MMVMPGDRLRRGRPGEGIVVCGSPSPTVQKLIFLHLEHDGTTHEYDSMILTYDSLTFDAMYICIPQLC